MTTTPSTRQSSEPARKSDYRWAMVLLLGAGAGLLWASASLWVSATASPAGLPQVNVSVTGREVLPSVGAAGIVALAGIAGVWATRGKWRALIGMLLVVVLGWATLTVVGFAAGLPATADRAVAGTAGLAPADLLTSQVTNWWWLALVAAMMGVVGAGVVTARGASWSAMGDQYARNQADAAAMTSAQVWDALDRGEDPTIDPEVSQ